MGRRSYIVLIIVSVFIAAFFNFGCGKYLAQFSPVTIISRYPSLGATGLGSGEVIWVKFSKSMDTASFEIQYLDSKVIFCSDMTATATFYPDVTPEIVWTEDDTKLTIRNVFFIAYPGNRVHLQASKEAFMDSKDDSKILENTDLWDYTLSGVSVTGRTPTIDATVTNAEMTVEVTFNNPIAAYSLGVGPDHTAGAPAILEDYLTNSDTTLVVHVSAFPSAPGVVDITAEVMDVLGNYSPDSQLWKFNIVP